MRRHFVVALLIVVLAVALGGCSSGSSANGSDAGTAPDAADAPQVATDGSADRPLSAAEQVEFAIKPQVGERMFVDGPAPDGEREAVLYERFNNFTSSGDPRWKVVDSQNEATFDRYEFSDGSAIIFNRENRELVDYLKSYEIE